MIRDYQKNPLRSIARNLYRIQEGYLTEKAERIKVLLSLAI
jgi:hypothetical protein